MKTEKTQTFWLNGYGYIVNKYGAICDAREVVQIRAGELHAIYTRAKFERTLKRPGFPEQLQSGWDVYFHVDCNGCLLHEGDVSIGCRRVPFKVLEKAHKLSVAMRAAKKPKAHKNGKSVANQPAEVEP